MAFAYMFVEIIPVVPRPMSPEPQEAIDVSSWVGMRGVVVGIKLSTHKEFVTGVPVNIHRYFDRSNAIA